MNKQVITWDYYEKNKRVVKAIGRRSEPTRIALNFLKNYKFAWVKELIENKKSLMKTLREEYNKLINKECRSLILVAYLNLRKEIEKLRNIQIRNPNLYAS